MCCSCSSSSSSTAVCSACGCGSRAFSVASTCIIALAGGGDKTLAPHVFSSQRKGGVTWLPKPEGSNSSTASLWAAPSDS